MSVRRWGAVAGLVGLMAASCGGSGSDDAADASSDAPGEVTSDTAASEEGSSGDGTVDDVSTTTPSTSPSTTSSTTTTVAPLAVATAESIDVNVEYRTAADVDFVGLTAPVDVAVGDVVRTDATGFAAVTYFDGSLTRLDVDTEFEVLELVDEVDASVVRTRMGLGRTWHRVQTLGEGGEFSVETSVATAVVRGTGFAVECRSETACTFVVVEGTVWIVLADGSEVELVAPAAVTVDGDVVGEVVAVPFDGAFGDDWVFDNAQRDGDVGFASAAEIYQAHGPEYASISGTFTGTRTVTSVECVTFCEYEPPVGDVADRSYTFEIDCSGGVPCAGTIDTEYRKGEATERQTTEVIFDGRSYLWSIAYSSPACFSDRDGDGAYETETGNLDTTVEWVMTPTAAEIIDDRWVVTEMSDLSVGGAVNTVTDPGECAGPDYWQGSSAKGDIVVTRVR